MCRMGQDRNEPFLLQLAERLADRRAAHAETRGQIVLGQRLQRHEIAGDDLPAQMLVDLDGNRRPAPRQEVQLGGAARCLDVPGLSIIPTCMQVP